jgi:hypothetical protein
MNKLLFLLLPLVPLLLVPPLNVNAQLPFLPSGNLTHLPSMAQPSTNSTANNAQTNMKNSTLSNTTTNGSTNANESLYLEGWGEAGHEYQNYLATNSDTGFNGAPQSLNYSYDFSSKQTDIHGPYAQGYYGFFGMKDSYTKRVGILGLKSIQHETEGGGLLDQEVITFINGTEITIPRQNVGLYHGHDLPTN